MRFLRRLVLALLIHVSGCAAPDSGSTDRIVSEDAAKSSPPLREPSRPFFPDRVVDQGEFRLPSALSQRGILLTLNRWGSTTLAFFDIALGSSVPLVTKSTGELHVSVSGGRVAYLAREGVNPTNNYIEVLDLKKRKRQLIEPAQDFAILGFSLSPGGDHLTFAQINLRRSRSDHVSWRIAVADFEQLASRISMTSPQKNLSGREIPVPIAWSGRKKEIYLQALVPFHGMVHHGIWTMASDGNELRQFLSEPSYTGLPRLSSDGTYLAYLGTKIDALPRSYIASPGLPPANVLTIRNLLTGEESVYGQHGEGVFGFFTWSLSGKEILVSRQEWLEGRFRDVALQRINKEGTVELRRLSRSPSLKVTGIAECSPGTLFWVEEEPKGATLLEAKTDLAPATLLTLPDGKIELINCLGGKAG